jgi:hypothetical protein
MMLHPFDWTGVVGSMGLAMTWNCHEPCQADAALVADRDNLFRQGQVAYLRWL